MTCIPPSEQVEQRIDKVLTQYRESPKLLHVARTYLGQVADVTAHLCDLPTYFDLDSAVGDQLTLLGKRMGWPRCHCVCDVDPVFGFACADEINFRPIVGFCDDSSSWQNCSTGLSDICITNDDLYRRFLQVRRYQYLNLYDRESLEECLHLFFGENAKLLHAGQGRVVVTPGRDLTQAELSMLQLYVRVLPVALGIRVMFHFGIHRVFGFGEGWGGFFEDDFDRSEQTLAFQRTGKIFGFCDDDEQIGGFCESWVEGDGLPFVTGDVDADGEPVIITIDDEGTALMSGPLTEDSAWICKTSAPWMCEIDVRPYDC